MEPTIKTKNLELSDFLRQYVKKKVKKLNKKEGAAGMEAILNYYASQR